MRNVYYRYNEKSKTYVRVYPNLRSRLLTYLRHALWFVLLGVAGYFVTLLLLGTPESADELREENARLQEELARAKDMQHQLFRLVPADRIIDLFREYPEEITKEQR